MDITIRRGTPADAARLAELAARTFRDTFADGTSPEDMAAHLAQAYGPEQQGRELADPNIVTLLVEADGTLVAYAQVRRGPVPACVAGADPIELWRFYVDRPWHGRGIAQGLMHRVDEVTHRIGGRTLWLGVWEHNARAKAFYHRCGFANVGAHVFTVGSDAQTDHILTRPVAPTALKAPRQLETARLTLIVPEASDAGEVFSRYAGDPEVTRYLGWPCHRSVADTQGFLAFSAAEWERWPAGPYLIRARSDGRLLGSTGLGFQQPDEALTGYVLAKDAWGLGYATEALCAMVELSRQLHLARVCALCHAEHRASQHVLDKCGFTREAGWSGTTVFPNLSPEPSSDVFRYELVMPASASALRAAWVVSPTHTRG
jgi:RimJ/RimL family protein N-acetyltransferase